MTNIRDRELRQFDALNNWLGDIYGEGTNFNTLLIQAGFDHAEVKQIKQEHLRELLQAIMNILDSYPDLRDEARNKLMVQHYGLSDGRPEGFYKMGANFGVCGERIRQLVHQRLKLYHNPARQAKFREDIATLGRRLLDNAEK